MGLDLTEEIKRNSTPYKLIKLSSLIEVGVLSRLSGRGVVACQTRDRERERNVFVRARARLE